MTFFNQIFHKIFKQQTDKPLIVKENFKRNEKYLTSYMQWLKEKKHIDLLRHIKSIYQNKKNNIISATEIHLFNTPSANGLALMYAPVFGKDNFQFLLDYFKDAILALNYQSQVAERQMTDKGDFVEMKEKYYLKPNYKLMFTEETPFNQLYGNILLEYVSCDDVPTYLKILITNYSDRLYQTPLDFNELFERLFEV